MVVILGVLALAACVPAAAHGRSYHGAAWLSLTDAHPLSVRGHAFHRRERVRVVARRIGGGALVRHVRAGRHGGFAVTFPTSSSGRCARWSVTATGRRGSRATLRGMMQPNCVAD
jgi:hypothetical protein